MINDYHIKDKMFKGSILVDTYFRYLEYHDIMIAQLYLCWNGANNYNIMKDANVLTEI